MRWVPLERGIRGIVVANGFHGILALHTWYDWSKVERIYDELSYISEDAQWMFFPIEAEERVSEVWIRQTPYETIHSPAVFVREQSIWAHVAANVP
jgi:hypothetical protein